MADIDFSASQTVKALLRLRDMILAGELEPGRRISELWVVEKLQVSRTPVRAALIRLQEEGLLEEIPSGGFSIRSYSPSSSKSHSSSCSVSACRAGAAPLIRAWCFW